MLVSTIRLFKVLYPSMSEKKIEPFSLISCESKTNIYLFIRQILLTLEDLGEC